MATALEIVRGISQVLANSYDGAFDEKGDPIKIGLKREEGNPIIDSRVIDGFGCTIAGNRLRISYTYECRIKDVHQNGFESEIASMVNKVKNFLTKEYKKVTGDALSLSKDGEIDIFVQPISMIRTQVRANQHYKIGKLGDVLGVEDVQRDKDPQVKDNAAQAKKFLATGKDTYPGTKKPKNVKSTANAKDPAVKRLKDMYKIKEALGETEPTPEAPVKQRGDVARVSKKMGATSGLGDMMQKIDNRAELQEFLAQVVKGISKKVSPGDVYAALGMVAKQVKKGA